MRHDLTPMIHLDHDQIARVAHEAYRTASTLMYDVAPAVWADAHDGHRRAMTMMVAAIAERPDETARAAHERWLAEHVQEGWVYAERFSAADRTSPVVRPWDELSPKYRTKQALMRAIIRHLLRPEAECA